MDQRSRTKCVAGNRPQANSFFAPRFTVPSHQRRREAFAVWHDIIVKQESAVERARKRKRLSTEKRTLGSYKENTSPRCLPRVEWLRHKQDEEVKRWVLVHLAFGLEVRAAHMLLHELLFWRRQSPRERVQQERRAAAGLLLPPDHRQPELRGQYAANLAAEGRRFTALSFCPDLCSVGALDNQVKLAIAQIPTIVDNDDRYDDGYVFIGYSQGGLIARAVIEAMDDHQVQAFIRLAGAQNGLFNGPQPTGYVPLLLLVTYFGPLLFPPTLFYFSQYSPADYAGKLQRDFEEVTLQTPELQKQLSSTNMGRSPYFKEWVKSNPFLPVYNNINDCKVAESITQGRDQALRLFASSGDDAIAPWQASLMAQYNNVNSLDEIQTKFESLKIVAMENTLEYVDDTYGLGSLDKRGRVFLHTMPGIYHSCWTSDSYPVAGGALCEFKPLYDRYIYPVLKDPLCYGRPKTFADAF